MKKTIQIETDGITNSARALENNEINISTLLKMQNINVESIADGIAYTIETGDEFYLEKIVNDIYNVYEVAKNWSKNYKVKKS